MSGTFPPTMENVAWHQQLQMIKFYVGSVEHRKNKTKRNRKPTKTKPINLHLKCIFSVQTIPQMRSFRTLVLPGTVLTVDYSLLITQLRSELFRPEEEFFPTVMTMCLGVPCPGKTPMGSITFSKLLLMSLLTFQAFVVICHTLTTLS